MNKKSVRIGITGATGLIGRKIVSMGLEKGYSLTIFIRTDSGYPKNWNEKVHIFKGDIASVGDLSPFVNASDVIIHLAAVVSDWAGKEAYEQISIGGTRNLLELIKGSSKKMVLASSIAVYGKALAQGVCVEEMSLPKPIGRYSWAKQEQEKLVRHYGRVHGIPFCIIRPGSIIGPHSRSWGATFIEEMKKGPILIGEGDQKTLCYVDNVAHLFLLAALDKTANEGIYNANDDLTLSWKEYANFLATTLHLAPPKSISRNAAMNLASLLEFFYRLFGIKKRPRITVESVYFMGYDFEFPYSSAAKELGYNPIVDQETALKDLGAFLEATYLK